ncbi:MAG: hypothetical protein VB076_06485 [Synergistaceae bacterium]|nr:hypothetical protein [Synergistaceae bacterium]
MYERVILMWWKIAGDGYRMPFGMMMMPLICLILVAVIIYLLCHRNKSHDEYYFQYKKDKDEMQKEIRELKEKIRELKKKEEDE